MPPILPAPRTAMRRLAADSDVSLEVMQQGYQRLDAGGWPNVERKPARTTDVWGSSARHLQRGMGRGWGREDGEQAWVGMSSMR